ncbi:hypothetical protein RIF29_15861 [Crotalaria pallida]|uniref:Uncharacterized protein n=1 Tax=Crotalaria pallida TaxID=3830 RepID=A0AAN9IBI9_CROPI
MYSPNRTFDLITLEHNYRRIFKANNAEDLTRDYMPPVVDITEECALYASHIFWKELRHQSLTFPMMRLSIISRGTGRGENPGWQKHSG